MSAAPPAGQDPVSQSRWDAVSSSRVIAASVALGLLALALLLDGDGFLPIVDHANLAFHEAGHLFFGILGEAAGLYGGTLGQLFFPAVAVASFAWRRDATASVLCAGWLFENLFNIARYAADARARELPLVGGGEHDWHAILIRWGALSADHRVATALRVLGALGIALAWAWLISRWWRDRRAQRA